VRCWIAKLDKRMPDPTTHAQELGKLVATLQSLEYLIRVFLYDRETAPPLADPDRWYGLKKGDRVPANSLTSFETLSSLVTRFNKFVSHAHAELQVDRAVVRLRDALAHGRATGESGSLHLTILKFGRERNGEVRVEFAAEMTDLWFADPLDLVAEGASRVREAMIYGLHAVLWCRVVRPDTREVGSSTLPRPTGIRRNPAITWLIAGFPIYHSLRVPSCPVPQ
jgi:hypothetical protein